MFTLPLFSLAALIVQKGSAEVFIKQRGQRERTERAYRWLSFCRPISGLFVKKLCRINELLISLQRIKESGQPRKSFYQLFILILFVNQDVGNSQGTAGELIDFTPSL